jgi:hypothetical protein
MVVACIIILGSVTLDIILSKRTATAATATTAHERDSSPSLFPDKQSGSWDCF